MNPHLKTSLILAVIVLVIVACFLNEYVAMGLVAVGFGSIILGIAYSMIYDMITSPPDEDAW